VVAVRLSVDPSVLPDPATPSAPGWASDAGSGGTRAVVVPPPRPGTVIVPFCVPSATV